ncbi:MAG TPA: TetR/AcrR family transcriptional regulator [Nevskiaceae bacterium]|nr:TetR/AcrR family transcriptional regulator [Nevskiaceae bacterium]
MGRPLLTVEAVDSMRQQLVAAALDIYRQEGLDAVSFRRLADAVGVSHTLAYRYFADKDALLTAMRIECTRHFERFVRGREATGAPLLERVRSVARAYVEFVKAHAEDYLLIFSPSAVAPSEYAELLEARRSLFEHAVEAVAECVAADILHGDPREIAHAFWVTLHGMMTLHVGHQLVHGRTLDQLFEPTIDRLLEQASSPTTARRSTRAAHARSARRSSRT